MNATQTLRLTPSNSPFFRSSTPKSPTKASRGEEAGLKLKKVIGTTTATPNGFDCLPSARQFAYTAGAAAVLCTVGDDLNVSQHFFRARPAAAGARDAAWPISPTPDLRTKAIGNLREQNVNGSPLGASLRDWSDSPTGKSATAKGRVKAATSVALSPDGKWIALGETGYKPRVLVFANDNTSSETPVCAISEHTFGVHALSFSPDSRYLASLGTVNDGFLYIWSIDPRTGTATLHSSNKCTSTVNVMTWVGRSVLTIGLRYIKLWKPDDNVSIDNRVPEVNGNTPISKTKASEFGNSVLSPRHKILAGKNSLLGDLLDANFIAAVPLNHGSAIICADSGEICLLDDIEATQTLAAMGQVGFRITAAMLDDSNTLHVAGNQGRLKRFNVTQFLKRGPAPTKRDRRSTISPFKPLPSNDAVLTVAMARIGEVTLELDSRRGIRLTKTGDSMEDGTFAASNQLAAHSEAVIGVQPLSSEKLSDAAFLTFTGSGAIQVWDMHGVAVASFQIPLDPSPDMYDLSNELKTVAHLRKLPLLAAGDKYGTVHVLDVSTGSILSQARAHSAEIVDIVAFEQYGIQLIATASRDRTVQLFVWRNERLDILQTMDDHAAAVTALTTAPQGNLLLSCSTDRTIVVREAILRSEDDPYSIAFIIVRTITMKTSPLSMCVAADGNELLVSTVDRCIGKYSIKNGQAGFSFKCSDMDGGEAAVVSKILYSPDLNGNPTIIGISSSDKSVRLYSEYGSLIARDWGHTEGITDVVLLPAHTGDTADSPPQVITVAADSTIFMWDTIASVAREPISENDDGIDSPAPLRQTPLAPPLRKVLSYSELSRFKREKSIDDNYDQTMAASTVVTPTQPPSPRRVKKKSSRTSIMPPPRLEPAFRPSLAHSRRESSARKRSPSPPSPRGAKKETSRKPSLTMALRSKSSENVLSSYATPSNSGSGSVVSSTESVCRNLRAYRKKLASASSEVITPNLLRELGTELKLTARVLGEKSQGKVIDEAIMAKLLDQASDRIVDRLDERIKERVDEEVRRSSGNSPLNGSIAEAPADIDAVAGALGKVTLD